MHDFEWWEEAGAPGENSCIYEENMQTPHRKAPARIQTRNPLANSANHHTTMQPKAISYTFLFLFLQTINFITGI